jgi:hypothetical protein
MGEIVTVSDKPFMGKPTLIKDEPLREEMPAMLVGVVLLIAV